MRGMQDVGTVLVSGCHNLTTDRAAKTTEMKFLTGLESGSPRSRYQPTWFPLQSLSVVTEGPSPPRPPRDLSSVCTSLVLLCVVNSSSYKDTGWIGSGPTHMASCSYFFKALFANSLILRYFGLGLSPGEFAGNTIQPL